MTQEQYQNHDCHMAQDDSCKTCEEYFSCPECHGTGENIIGDYDDVDVKPCHCTKDLSEVIEQ